MRNERNLCLGLMLASVLMAQSAWAKNIVSADVPLDSKFYTYVDKLEGMGYITDLTSTTRPWSRYDVAKMVAKINPKGMPKYLKIYYDELCDAFSDEIAFAIAHDGEKTKTREGHLPEEESNVQGYYADKHNTLVAEKVKLAKQSERFPSNFALRGVTSELGFRSQNDGNYDYSQLNGSRIAADFQALNSNNNGYRYGRGWNWVNELHLSGSLSNDVAVAITPRFSLDKDQHGKGSLKEGYVRTHVGQLAITVGRQPLQWGGGGRYGATALSSNATPQTMVRLGLVEPVKIERGALRFLGKVNATAFVSKLDNRENLALERWGRAARETNDMKLVGLRAEVQPVDTWSIGLERVSMLRGVNKDWFIGKNADKNDLWNDIAGFDTLIKFPGVQLYGSIYGENQAGYLPTRNLFSAGVYFPQLSQDGRWDLRLEGSRSDDSSYTHGSFINGWSYRGDILGENMGREATQYQGLLRYHADSGDIWSLQYRHTGWKSTMADNPKLQEFSLGVDHRVNNIFHVGVAFGLAKMYNYSGRRDGDTTKFGLVKLNWSF